MQNKIDKLYWIKKSRETKEWENNYSKIPDA